jgi:hypothetical protein
MKKILLLGAFALSFILLCRVASATSWTINITPDHQSGNAWSSTMSNCTIKTTTTQVICDAVNHDYEGSHTLSRGVDIQESCPEGPCMQIRLVDQGEHKDIFMGSFSDLKHTKAGGDWYRPSGQGSIHGTWTATFGN